MNYFCFKIYVLIISSYRPIKDGSGLAGVTITVKGSKSAVQTDENGNFSIVTPPNATLIFTSASYERREIAIANQSSIQVPLLASTEKLSEVVVIGYGTVRKKDLTGSVKKDFYNFFGNA